MSSSLQVATNIIGAVIFSGGIAFIGEVTFSSETAYFIGQMKEARHWNLIIE